MTKSIITKLKETGIGISLDKFGTGYASINYLKCLQLDNLKIDKMFVDEKESVLRIEEDKITLERPIDDEFYIIQRLLQFCPKIYYVSDERIRNLLKEKLLLIKAMYGGKIDE